MNLANLRRPLRRGRRSGYYRSASDCAPAQRSLIINISQEDKYNNSRGGPFELFLPKESKIVVGGCNLQSPSSCIYAKSAFENKTKHKTQNDTDSEVCDFAMLVRRSLGRNVTPNCAEFSGRLIDHLKGTEACKPELLGVQGAR